MKTISPKTSDTSVCQGASKRRLLFNDLSRQANSLLNVN